MVHQYGFLEPIELHSRLVIAPRTLTVNDTTGSGGGDMCYQKQTKSTLLRTRTLPKMTPRLLRDVDISHHLKSILCRERIINILPKLIRILLHVLRNKFVISMYTITFICPPLLHVIKNY